MTPFRAFLIRNVIRPVKKHWAGYVVIPRLAAPVIDLSPEDFEPVTPVDYARSVLASQRDWHQSVIDDFEADIAARNAVLKDATTRTRAKNAEDRAAIAQHREAMALCAETAPKPARKGKR